MSEAHTPGPWELWTSCSWRRFKDKHGRSVCEPTVCRDGHPDLIVTEADARLIAAAPELLDIAKVVHEACPTDVKAGDGAVLIALSVEEVLALRAAISKATGSTS